MIRIASEDHFQQVITGEQVVLVDFYADWCEPCKYLDQVLERLEKRLPAGFIIAKCDTESLPALSKNFQVMSVPVLILFIGGKEAWRMNGFHLEDELLAIITRVSRETR